MSFFKKVKRKALKIINPVMGKKIGDALLGKEKKPGAASDPGLDVFGNRKQGDEFYQSELGKEQENYRGTPDAQRKAVTDAAKAAGTYSDTREGAASIEAESGARTRGIQSASLARINLLRKQLGLPESSSAI